MNKNTTKPYLIRAIYEWALDNGYTPYLMVFADKEGTTVPSQHVNDGKIVLNVHPGAVKDLSMENRYIFFSAAFGGEHMNIEIPVSAVGAIYARETGEGLSFDEEDTAPDDLVGTPSDQAGPEKPSKKTSHLKLVK
ncbi:MAG: ClpXP protease specificity-enhancing factor [Gammaproteobacteria bacterium]|nr:MAG: ClpXP protease specificity-enhancing factor [Gammaproteobacteria bacterium]RTZ60259.1 MAG: ClpXP protease specificity-enhancing factor [Gammaproteobacteria bacterium]